MPAFCVHRHHIEHNFGHPSIDHECQHYVFAMETTCEVRLKIPLAHNDATHTATFIDVHTFRLRQITKGNATSRRQQIRT